MAYASKLGKARISSRNPQGAGVCDRCGFVFNHVNLQWQYDWRGAALQNLRLLVCSRCTDTPQQQLRAIVLPADPTPIMNSRVENYADAETDFFIASTPTIYDACTGIPVASTNFLVTEAGSNLTPQAVGSPLGLEPGAVMPLQENVTYGALLPVLSVSSNGTTTITVTCSQAHGQATNNQISVEGLSNTAANGFYSITVTTATAFTYQVNSAIPTSSLLTSTTRIITAIVGLPINYPQIVQIGT